MQLARRLLKKGCFSEGELSKVEEAISSSGGKPPHEVILEKGFAKEPELLQALSEEFGLELVDLADRAIAEDVLQSIPAKVVHRRQLVPLEKSGADRKSVV